MCIYVYASIYITDGYYAKLFPIPLEMSYGLVSVFGSGFIKSTLQISLSDKKIWFALGETTT